MDTSTGFPHAGLADRLDGPVRRIVLLGLMGSGKTTIGAALAARLGWVHVDFDELIEIREGRSIARIFRESGEPYFRSLEREITRSVENGAREVLSPGGGWITHPGVLRQLGRGTFSVWLDVNVDEALERLATSTAERPLLDTPDRRVALERILAERRSFYQQADLVVPAGRREPYTIVWEIENSARRFGLVSEQD